MEESIVSVKHEYNSEQWSILEADQDSTTTWNYPNLEKNMNDHLEISWDKQYGK